MCKVRNVEDDQESENPAKKNPLKLIMKNSYYLIQVITMCLVCHLHDTK